MKKFLTLAIAVIATMGLTMSASCATNGNNNEQKTERHDKKQIKGDKKTKEGKKFNPFEGLNLSEDQQNQLKSLFANKGERKAPKEAPCCKGDTAACCQGNGAPCCWKLSPEQLQAKATEQLSKIKSILSSEQYQQYLENVAKHRLMKKDKPSKKGAFNKKQGKGNKSANPGKSGERKHPQPVKDKEVKK